MSGRVVSVSAVTALLVSMCFGLAGSSPSGGESLTFAESLENAPASSTPADVGHPTFVSPHANPIAVAGDHVFVVNTPADTLDVIDAKTRKVVARTNVGIDPVSVAIRPDGREVWVSNHISDSVSVIDNVSDSPTYRQVIATIQDIDLESGATRFDEPVGIAFANNSKAYVALSSENQVAVIDVEKRQVARHLKITAQDPRAITVRNGRLYVIPFESNNKTQLSGGAGDKIDGDLVTFDAWQHSVRNNNVLSLGHVVDIVKHPDVPDRDLYVFDTETDELIEVVDTLGTLLYGLTVDSKGNVFVAQTDARNDINGRSGTKKHGLKELQNRAFLNQITRVSAGDGKAAVAQNSADSGQHSAVAFIDLEPLPPENPADGQALATPFGIQVTGDDSTLVATAAGSDMLFTVDANTGSVLGRAAVGAVPRGVAIQESDTKLAWVFNAVDNSVSVVDFSVFNEPTPVGLIELEDPTHPVVKRGRIAFETASASTTGTFSCASCHPDGHTDQLLWVLATPVVSGGDQIMPRSTMPIRGLRDTAPYHWDGIPGDPYGGNNSASIHRSVPANSDPNIATSTTRHLIDGGLENTMGLVGDTTVNDEGKAGQLSAAERDDMAVFLLSVPYPPAQRRSFTNVVSERASSGFELFHVKGHHDEKPRPNVCGDCHRMPFLVSTNTPGTGMDAPTWRGANDRFLILPQGRLNIIEFDFYRRITEDGIPERQMWQFSWQGQRRFDPVWDMVLEGSTGYSGSLARQVTLNAATVDADLTRELLAALEQSAREGAVVLEGEGVVLDGDESQAIALQFDGTLNGGAYVSRDDNRKPHSRDDLLAMARDNRFVVTLTARHGRSADVDHPQPALWTRGPIQRQRGRQQFPILHPEQRTMEISGRHLNEDAALIVDGRKVEGSITLEGNDRVSLTLRRLPENGMHLIQVQNPDGLFSNDFIFYVAKNAEAAAALKEATDREHADIRDAISEAIAAGDKTKTLSLLNRQRARINERSGSDQSTPLSTAALHNEVEIAKVLIRRGADVHRTNADGNTALHVAAFLCNEEVVELLLSKGASVTKENRRGESPVDVVSGEWSDELAGFYQGIGRSIGDEVDLERIQKIRPKIAERLRQHAQK